MNRHAVVAVLASLALLVALPAAPVLAAGSLATKPSRLAYFGTDARLGFNDNGAAGSSAGDVRTLALTLRTASGSAVGTIDVVQTLTDEGAVDRAIKVLVITLPKGTISAQGLTAFDDFINPASRPNDRVEQLAIVGGTGKYRGASGIVDIEVLPNFRSRWIISID
jgi:hypothetical protein